MFGIVHFVYLENFLPPDDDQRLLDREPQNFVRGEDRTLADTRGFPVFRRVVGDTPGTQLLGFAGYRHRSQSRAGRNKLRRQFICAAQEQLRVAVAQNFLPEIERIPILQARQVLKHTAHRDIS